MLWWFVISGWWFISDGYIDIWKYIVLLPCAIIFYLKYL